MDAKQRLTGFISEFLKALSDINFEHIVTTRMLPTIYVVGIIFAALTSLYFLLNAWEGASWAMRVLWLLFFAPGLFVGIVTVWRVMLELCLSLFELTVVVRALHDEVQKVSGMTDEIATDLPRITFWRGRKTGSRSKDE